MPTLVIQGVEGWRPDQARSLRWPSTAPFQGNVRDARRARQAIRALVRNRPARPDVCAWMSRKPAFVVSLFFALVAPGACRQDPATRGGAPTTDPPADEALGRAIYERPLADG